MATGHHAGHAGHAVSVTVTPPVASWWSSRAILRTPNATSESVEFVEIKPRETMQQLPGA